MKDYLDPAKLTKEQLYRLQSETWIQGQNYESERIIKLLEEASISFEKFDFDSVATTNFLIRLINGDK